MAANNCKSSNSLSNFENTGINPAYVPQNQNISSSYELAGPNHSNLSRDPRLNNLNQGIPCVTGVKNQQIVGPLLQNTQPQFTRPPPTPHNIYPTQKDLQQLPPNSAPPQVTNPLKVYLPPRDMPPPQNPQFNVHPPPQYNRNLPPLNFSGPSNFLAPSLSNVCPSSQNIGNNNLSETVASCSRFNKQLDSHMDPPLLTSSAQHYPSTINVQYPPSYDPFATPPGLLPHFQIPPLISNTCPFPDNVGQPQNFLLPPSSSTPLSQTPQLPPPPFPTSLLNSADSKHFSSESHFSPAEQWLQRWLTRNRIPTLRGITPKIISISEYKKKVVHLMVEIKELEKMLKHLQIMTKSLDDSEWSIRRKEIENQKKVVEEATNKLNEIPLQQVMTLLKKRKMKRLRLKRKREQLKEIQKENKAICQLEHARIDMWLEKMKEQVERTRREESIKRQADVVLSEVHQKKAEAKRMLSLLTTLGKLRNARIQDRESKGEFVSKEAAASFNNIIENLKKRWLDQINGYNVEEKGLTVMLEDAEAKRSNVEDQLNRQILQQWSDAIFGDKHKKQYPFQVSTIADLISVRKSWDQWVVSDIGSNMPVGWVLPSPPTSDKWIKFLKT